jgi:trehalose 6-phosphate synthase/phosphatase
MFQSPRALVSLVALPTPSLQRTPAPAADAASYFNARREGGPSGDCPEGKDDKKLADKDPRAAHPGLGLSGRVISANFAIPYRVGYSAGKDWELKPRSGTSALFDSFAYLSSSASQWNHTLVGWTGEIDQVISPSDDPTASLTSGQGQTNKAAAPIPVDSKAAPPPSPQTEGLRIGKEDRKRLEQQLERDETGKIVPVWLVDEVDESQDQIILKDQSRWRRYAERELYTLFHYKQNGPTDGRDARKTWADYYRLNKLFADKILELYRPGDIIIIHDFYLLLLPSLLRQNIPNIYIGFFLHVPFPSSEFYRCLSRRKEILEGVLGANMIGFQAFSYARHFSSCCTRILGFDSSSRGVDAYGAHVSVDVFPIGINAARTAQIAFNDPATEEKVRGIREIYSDKKIIVGRDRLDSVRGVAQKLQAFEMFLERYPEWRGKVVLIQVTSPSSVQVIRGDDDDTKVLNKISDLVARINGDYGSLSFVPVQHFPQYLSREEYFALLRVADVGLITSVRDGMNTTSLEYVICQKEKHSPLILSEFSGTAGPLSGAMHINPWDLGGVAEAINNALTMPKDEREDTFNKLFKYVVSNTVQSWTDNYLKALLNNLESFDQTFQTPALDRAKLLYQYRQAKHRLFMFDYDGTLTPIVKDPGAAIPSDRVVRTLKRLAADPANSVWIISGRDQKFLDDWMGHIPELGLSAEHGSFIRQPRSSEWEDLTKTADMSWQQEVLDTFQHFTERTTGGNSTVSPLSQMIC